MRLFKLVNMALITLSTLCGIASAQKWTSLKRQPPFQTDTGLLLTDGTVMVHEYDSPTWWQLTPDNTGSYLNGTWSPLASMPSDYAPLYFASAVLADGRVLVEGGEYNFLVGDDTNDGEIYDPVKDLWTKVDPPDGWHTIGDSPAIVLANGTFMIGQKLSTATAFFNAKTLGWTLKGSGKADIFDEEGFNLLVDGSVLTVDIGDVPDAERYVPSLDRWISAGKTVQPLAILGNEIGPGLLRPDGTVFYMGATTHTGIYIPPVHSNKQGTWKRGPDFPTGDMGDAPAAVLPNGNVLCETGGIAPTAFYEFDGTKFVKAPSPKNPGNVYFAGRMLVLPTGQVLFTIADGVSIDVELYKSNGTYKNTWAPTITSAPNTIAHGQTYQVSGTQFNGLTAGANYGDDAQMATNYPLVRITNNSTRHVFYARTHDHSTMGVATGKKTVFTHFDVPSDIETGDSTLVVGLDPSAETTG
jgi:hypothetical protein